MSSGLIICVVALGAGVFTALHALTLRFTRAPDIVEFPLQPGERQLWVGVPVQGLVITRGDVLQSCVGVLFGAFVLFVVAVMLKTAGQGADVIAIGALVLGPLLLGSYVLIAGRLIEEVRARRLTTYAITNQRVIVNIGRTMRARAIELADKAALRQNPDGSGTIIFDAPAIVLEDRDPATRDPEQLREAAATIGSFMAPYHRFANIPDAARVYAILQQAVAGAR